MIFYSSTFIPDETSHNCLRYVWLVMNTYNYSGSHFKVFTYKPLSHNNSAQVIGKAENKKKNTSERDSCGNTASNVLIGCFLNMGVCYCGLQKVKTFHSFSVLICITDTETFDLCNTSQYRHMPPPNQQICKI